MNRSLCVLLLVHPQMRPDVRGATGPTERDVWKTLRTLGHRVEIVALDRSLVPLDKALSRQKVDIVFNLLEEYRDEGVFDFHPISWLEARGIPYTGCNPRGLIVSRNKEWAASIARGRGLRVPEPAGTSGPFPAFVKFVREHASRGLTRQSRVTNAAEFRAARSVMKAKYAGEILGQEFISGTDVTVSVWGNAKVRVMTPWRLDLRDQDHFATERIKFSRALRRRAGVRALQYRGPGLKELSRAARQLYQALDLSGYARLDFRVNPKGQAFFIDANANPNLARDEDFARAARQGGLEYPQLVQEILRLGLRYEPRI